MDDTDREKLALQVFCEICELPEPQRSTTLEQRCASDLLLRDKVAALLKSDSDSPSALGADAVERFLQTEIGQIAGASIKPQASPGEALKNDYRLLRVLGEGGMATVYEAEQQHPRRLVAIKIVRSGSFAPELRRRFEYEAQILARLQHPNIAQLYEADTHPGGDNVCAYLAMELVRGLPIDEYAGRKFLNIRKRVELVLRVCDAVEYAHRMGVLHRDLKPANILVQDDGQPKILDFGVARTIDRDERWATVLTHAGQVIGTLPYMSPEQIDPKTPADTRADVYALGVLLYKLLTEKLPVNVSDCGIAEAARRICEEVPAAPSTFDRSLRGDLDVIVTKALEKDPERRYRGVSAFSADIRRYLEGRAIEARGGSSLYVLRKTIWRFRRTAAVAGAFVAMIVAFAIYAQLQSRHNRDLAKQAAESRDSAVAARDATDRNADQLRRSLYFSNIGFAQAALEINDIGHVSPLLNGCPPDLRGWEWGYLRLLSDRSQKTWPTQTGPPRSLDISKDHSRIAVGADASVSVLDAASGERLFSRAFSDGAVASAISPDGRYLAAGPFRDEMCLVDLNSGKEAWTVPEMPPPPFPMLRKLRAISFNPDGKALACAGYDGHIRLRETATGTVLQDIDAKTLSVLCMAFTSDGRFLVGGDDRGHLRMWNLQDGSLVHERTPHEGSVACVAISPDGTKLASGANDGKVVLRNFADWSDLATVSAGKPIVWSLAFSPDGTRIAAGSDDNLLRLWKIGETTPPAILRGHADTVNFIAFEPGGHSLISASADATVKRWDLEHLAPETTIAFENVATYAAAFASGGVLISCNDGSVRLWDRAASTERWRYSGAVTTLRSLAIDPKSARIATCGDDVLIRVLDLHDGHPLQMIEWKTKQIGAVALFPDGKTLAAGDVTGLLRTWNLDSNPAEPIASIPAHPAGIISLAIAPDGVHFATADYQGSIQLWALGNPQPLASVHPSHTTARDIAFDSSGQILASGHTDGSIWILDATTLKPLRELRGHQGSVNGIAFQPGHARLASGGNDRTVRIWDVTSGSQVLTLHGHRRPIQRLAFSADGATLASTSLDGTVQLWDSQR